MAKSEKAKSSTGHKIMTVIGVILCIILVPILIINCTLIVKSYTDKESVPSIGGVMPLIVLTDSMNPDIESGDLVICHTEKAENVKVGDVISFFDPMGNGESVVTHRVVEITTDNDGNLAWVTKGDANNTNDLAIVPAENLVGVYQRKIPNMGNVAMFMQTTQGLIICVVLPIVLLVAYDVIRRRIYEKNKKDDKDELLAELNALKAEKAERDSEN
ncbi:MAG: signal peptidase I [Clostridia bacterium]|nr:signal peptidase I [Clostridia bacterium]